MASTDLFDIANRYGKVSGDDLNYVNRTEAEKALKKLYEDKTTLSFTDMLGLMIAEFQNQTIDNQASTTDMMNQLVQMSSMQAMTSMVTQMNELTLANVMSYSRTLVDQYVTVCDGYEKDGTPIEYYGRVIGTGTYNGQQVVFMDNNKTYYLSQIMAVGKLPEKTQTPGGSEKPDDGDGDKDPEVKIPDNLDPDYSQGGVPEVKVPDNLDPGYNAGDKDPEENAVG